METARGTKIASGGARARRVVKWARVGVLLLLFLIIADVITTPQYWLNAVLIGGIPAAILLVAIFAAQRTMRRSAP